MVPLVICHEIYYMPFVNSHVIHSAAFTETITTNIGGNTYQNEMVTYFYVTRPNHATALKVASLKDTHLNMPHDYMTS